MITDREVTFDVRAGWTTPQGMEALRLDLEQYAPQTIVISLGTNDGSDPRVFADRVRRILRYTPPYACVVWPAIIRPKRKGEYRGLNRVLRDEARRDRRLTDHRLGPHGPQGPGHAARRPASRRGRLPLARVGHGRRRAARLPRGTASA